MLECQLGVNLTFTLYMVSEVVSDWPAWYKGSWIGFSDSSGGLCSDSFKDSF